MMRAQALFVVSLLIVVTTVSSCGVFGSDEGLDYGTFEGIYTYNMESSSFSPCSEEEQWWVISGDTDLVERYQELTVDTQAVVYVRLEGDPGPEGEYDYGPAGTFDREFEVEEVLEVRFATSDDCN